MASTDERLHDLVRRPRFAKEMQRHSHQHLQRGHGAALAGQRGVARDCLRGRPDAREQVGELRPRDGRQPDADAFHDRVQMGRGEQADAQPRAVQHGGDHGGGGALAVGAGDMDRGHRQVRVVQLAQQRPHALRAVAVALARRRGLAEVGQAHQSFDSRLEGSLARHGGIVNLRRIRCKAGSAPGATVPGGGPW